MQTSESSAPIDRGHALFQMLRRTDRVMYKARQKELDRYHMTAEAAAVLLCVLRLGDRATPGAISRMLFLERNSISEHLARMEKEGLVNKVKDLDRKNLVRVRITSKGAEAYRKSARRRSTRQIMSVLTPEDQKLMWLLLSRLQVKALKHLRAKDSGIYPPMDPEQLWPD